MGSNLELLRHAEAQILLDHLHPGMKVLELGGGNGYQAKVLHDHGCQVTSLDIPGRERPEVQYFPVEEYDGLHIPCPDASFDAVFSQSVLEHVRDLPALFSDLRRVLRPDGFMVHIVPSPVWRFWTSAVRYPYLVKYMMRGGGRRRPSRFAAKDSQFHEIVGHRATPRRIFECPRRALLFPAPHMGASL